MVDVFAGDVKNVLLYDDLKVYMEQLGMLSGEEYGVLTQEGGI